MAELVIVVLVIALRLYAALTRQRRCGHRAEYAMRTCVALNCTGHVWMDDEVAVRYG